ncbi:MAG: hypothetical protein EZS28_054177, partial [Streblomastix strix]
APVTFIGMYVLNSLYLPVRVRLEYYLPLFSFLSSFANYFSFFKYTGSTVLDVIPSSSNPKSYSTLPKRVPSLNYHYYLFQTASFDLLMSSSCDIIEISSLNPTSEIDLIGTQDPEVEPLELLSL